MTALTRLMLAGATLALLAAGCGSTASSPTASSPTASSATAPSATASPGASTAASTAPTSAPSLATPSPSVLPSTAACATLPSTGVLPSDRLVDLEVAGGASADRLTFVFGNPSLPGPAAPPQGSLDVAQPPYTQAGSGATIRMTGDRVVQVRFSGMSIANDVGQPTYSGPEEVKPALAALRHAVLFDASEGIVGWYVGYDGSGCLELVRNGNNVTLVIPHG